GVLRYRQLSKSGAPSSQVYIGMRSAPENTRGVFEIFNPGSQFQMYSGDIYIARAHDVPATATRAALYLDPASTGLNKWGDIQIGLPGTTPASSTIKINATPDLCHLTIDADVTAQLDINPLSLVGQLDIISGSTFDGNGLNLSLYDDIDNAGTTNLNVDTLLFVGNEQEITGDITVQNMNVNPTTTVTVNTSSNVTVTNELILTNGSFNDNGETIVVEGNLTNNATHSSSGTGRIKLAGSALQNIFGDGDFANLELDNAAGARLNNSMNLTGDLYLTNGIFDIQAYNLHLSENSAIQGSSFDNSKMIASNGSYADLGLTKEISSGAQTLLFPVGIISGADYKYTPVSFDITGSDNPGTIRLYGVNQEHMTATGTDVLQYFWTVESSGLSNFNAEMTLNYLNSDVVGTEADYISAHLYDDSWAKFPTSAVDETADQITFTFPGVSSISGDFTAGIDPHIPTDIPIFESTGSGNWSDVSLWYNADGYEAPAGGPNGHIVRVATGTTVTMDRFHIQAYRTELEGRLEIGAEVGHNIGKVSGGGTLALVTEKWPVGDFSQFMAAGTGSTIEYGGGTYNIPEVNGNYYNNLIITGAGTKTTPYDRFYVRNNLLVTNGATFKNTKYLQLYGNFTLDPSAIYSPNHYIYFDGSEEQIISGNFTGVSALRQLLLSKAANNVIFTDNVEVTSTFYILRGALIIPENKTLTLKDGIYSGSESYITSGQTWIEGNLTIYLNNGSSSSGTTNLFPIGKDGKTRFVRLDAVSNNGTAKSPWTVEYFPSNPHEAGFDTSAYTAPIEKVGVLEHWMVSGPAGSETSVSVEWGAESGVDPTYLSDLLLAEWEGTQWINKGGAASGDETSGVINNTDASVFNTKNISKSYTLGASSSDVPLPITLLNFDAQAKDNSTVDIRWTTATEQDNDYFVVEKSRDGVVFTKVAQIKGAGNSATSINYHTTDNQPYDGISYYRLRQVDFDGEQELFPMVAVEIEGLTLNEPRLNVHPNPYADGNILVDIDGFDESQDANVLIADLSGSNVWSGRLVPTREEMTRALQPQFEALKPGFYIVVVVSNDRNISTRIVKK
ncbi:MAG: T9SS type A sorting domain-containing protein, partial [Salinivirgaceae bacterium]|nr:T9SS type A sorting domain-containing protein [Salinivirgaceae bacterium]